MRPYLDLHEKNPARAPASDAPHAAAYAAHDQLPRQRLADELTALGFPITRKTLENLAHKGDGPPYRVWGAGPRAWTRQHVDVWIRS